MKRLKGVETPLANFFASGVLCLREKLGPILWQLPPSLGFDPDRLSSFFDLLPGTTAAAADLAKRHDARLAGRVWTEADADRPIRHALEVRHPAYRTPEFIRLLRRHRVALCVADAAGKFPYLEDVTSDFVYVRLHGAEQLYASGYTDSQLDRWAGRVEAWRAGGQPADPVLAAPDNPPPKRTRRDVFVYFDNDVHVHAPYDAMNLSRKVGLVHSADVAERRPEGVAGEAPRTSWPGVRRRGR